MTNTPNTPAHDLAHAAMRRHNRRHPEALIVEVEGPGDGETTFMPLADAVAEDDRYIYRAVLSQEGELHRMIHFNKPGDIERDLPVAQDEVMDALRALDRIADADGVRITVHVGPISITITAGACTL